MRRAVACGLALTLALLPSGRGSFHTGGPESYFPLWEEPSACREGGCMWSPLVDRLLLPGRMAYGVPGGDIRHFLRGTAGYPGPLCRAVQRLFPHAVRCAGNGGAVPAVPGRVHISVRTRLLGKFLPSSMLKILEVRQYICEFSP